MANGASCRTTPRRQRRPLRPRARLLADRRRSRGGFSWLSDYDDTPAALAALLGEYPGAERLADAARLADAGADALPDDDVRDLALGVMLDRTCTRDLGELSDDFADWVSYNYAGSGATLADWCAEYLEEAGTLHANPEDLRNYFDHESYARDMELGGEVTTQRAAGAVHVFWNR